MHQAVSVKAYFLRKDGENSRGGSSQIGEKRKEKGQLDIKREKLRPKQTGDSELSGFFFIRPL